MDALIENPIRSIYRSSFYFMLILCVFSTVLLSQTDGSVSWLPPVQRALKAEDFKTAETLLKKALKKAQDPVPIWRQLGQLFVLQENWSEAKSWFERVKKKNPNDLTALYYLGICHREIGKYQAFFIRGKHWSDSENYFEQILQTDPSFKDTYYQFAILKRYDKKFEIAIDKACQQLKLKPHLEEVNIGLFALYRALLLHREYDQAAQWLLQQSDDVSIFFLGELFRQNHRYDSADSIYQALLGGSTRLSPCPIYLARVRLNIARRKPLVAETVYWQAVDSIEDSLDARYLFEDIKYICIDDEVGQYRSLTTVPQWHNFYRKFWVKREPLPASADNLRLVEHYRRLVYAEENFRYDGFRTWVANPDQQEYLDFPQTFYLNDEFNDKGLVYIRHGEPDDKATALGESVRYNESWLYRERDGLPKMIFHFEIDPDGLAGDWRLTPFLQDSSAISSVIMWDDAYARYLRGDATIASRVANEIANISKERVSLAMKTDRHSWDKKVDYLPVSFYIANFRDSQYRDLCEFYYGFPVEDLFTDISADSAIHVDLGIALFDRDWNEVAKRNEVITMAKNAPSIVLGESVGEYRFTLAPRFYHLAFHVDPIESPLLGGFKMQLTLPTFAGSRLICSDVQLAHDIKPKQSGQKISKKNMTAVPNPSKRFRRTDPLHAYFEIYNLSQDSGKRTRYSVNYIVQDEKGKKKRGFLGLFGGKESGTISVESEREGSSEKAEEYINLDVSQLEPGLKRLLISVKDLNSQQSDRVETVFELL